MLQNLVVFSLLLLTAITFAEENEIGIINKCENKHNTTEEDCFEYLPNNKDVKQDALVKAISKCEDKHNTTEEDCFEYLINNEDAPLHVKEFYVCFLDELHIIRNGTIIEEFESDQSSNITNAGMAGFMQEVGHCIDHTIDDLTEKVFQLLRCIINKNIEK